MSRKSTWLHLLKHLAERQNQRNCTVMKIMNSWKSDDLLDHHTWNLVAGLFTLPLIRRLSGLQFRLLMRLDRLTKTTLQTLNFISAEKLLVSHTRMTARLCWSEDRHRHRKSKEGEFRKRSRDNWVRDRRAKKKSLLPVLSVSEAPSGMKSYLGQNSRGEENQTINRPPTEINSALSGSLSWHIPEKCLPLLSHKLRFPQTLALTTATRVLKFHMRRLWICNYSVTEIKYPSCKIHHQEWQECQGKIRSDCPDRDSGKTSI